MTVAIFVLFCTMHNGWFSHNNNIIAETEVHYTLNYWIHYIHLLELMNSSCTVQLIYKQAWIYIHLLSVFPQAHGLKLCCFWLICQTSMNTNSAWVCKCTLDSVMILSCNVVCIWQSPTTTNQLQSLCVLPHYESLSLSQLCLYQSLL